MLLLLVQAAGVDGAGAADDARCAHKRGQAVGRRDGQQLTVQEGEQ